MAHINPLVPYKAPVVVLEDNKDINRDREVLGRLIILTLTKYPFP